jgi:hypothetical protein
LLVAAIVALITAGRRVAARVAVAGVALVIAGGLGLGLPTSPGDLLDGIISPGPAELQVRAAQASGWEVQVPSAPGADAYEVSINGTVVASVPSSGLVTVREPAWSAQAYAARPVHQFTVVALSGGRAVQSWTTRTCAPVVFLAARGTGENPPKSQFAHGVGSRGWRTWQQLAKLLGVSASQAGHVPTVVLPAPVHYPADAIRDGAVYVKSRDEGVQDLRRMWNTVVSACPDSAIVAFGYSQGADVVASVWEESTLDTASTFGVVLFADPHFNREWVRQGIVFPEDGVYKKDGLLGPRPIFDDDRLEGLQAWCWPADPVCQSLPSLRWHGDAYDCYELHAARELAVRLAPRLRDHGYRVLPIPPETCPLDTRGRDET